MTDDHDRSATGTFVRPLDRVRGSDLERPEAPDAGADPVMDMDRPQVHARGSMVEQSLAHPAVGDGR